MSDTGRLREDDEARTRFMAAISHDLQTPIGAILGSLDLMEEPAGGDAELFDVIRRNAEQLRTLAAQLSEFSRLERGHLGGAPEPVELTPLVHDCLRRLAPLFQGVDARVEVAGTVHADPHAVDRIVANLLANAVQHGPVGAPVTITSQPVGPSIVVCVQDCGPGVAPADRRHVFEAFRRGRGSSHGPGLGLGLPIVAHHVAQQGGTVWVEDGDTGGARFCFTLPAGPTQPATTDEDVHGTP